MIFLSSRLFCLHTDDQYVSEWDPTIEEELHHQVGAAGFDDDTTSIDTLTFDATAKEVVAEEEAGPGEEDEEGGLVMEVMAAVDARCGGGGKTKAKKLSESGTSFWSIASTFDARSISGETIKNDDDESSGAVVSAIAEDFR